ncbi:alpha/beta fold hydrolase [Marinobacter sp. X15-166B]|uniref:alpha/beta fold hydrolase n=1 Tax=Marinobacter sp. X15-166B TaxID=1897620 RepID=UPI00085BB92B|nr:alpha/beta fold hydrolase [Marinobacter sp. X15-166B]OEY66461.1 acyl-CoA esterase [Marinobacter sp. X15-166B]
MSVALNSRVTGQGEPLIVLHGLFGSLENLGAVSQQLKQDYEIHGLDLRNHGGSPHTDSMDYPGMAADVIAYMDAQGLGQAHFLGHSMGGKVAMQLALSYPQRVARLIVADISPVTYPPHHNEVLEGLQALDLHGVTSRKQADEALAPYVDTPGVRQFLLKNLVRLPADEREDDNLQFQWRLNVPVIVADYPKLARAPEGEGAFDGPVLFLKGANSAYIQTKHHEQINRLFPDAEIRVIEDAGHWLHAEQTAEFVACCQAFLSRSL